MEAAIIKELIFDIEADHLYNPTVVHCISTVDVQSGLRKQFVGDDIRDFPDYASRFDRLVGHNVLGYDIPVCKALIPLFHWTISGPNVRDTFVLSKLHNFSIEGGHGLKAWGQRLGLHKGDFNGPWDTCTEEMLEYNRQDAEVTLALYSYFKKHYQGDRNVPVDLEHRIAALCQEMWANGFPYDKETADSYRDIISHQIEELDKIIMESYPPTIISGRVGKHGRPLKDIVVEFNPNSVQQVIDKLWDAGWKPTEKTTGHLEFLKSRDRGDPTLAAAKRQRYETYGWKLNESNLSSLPDDAPHALKSIIKRTILETRVRKLDEWAKAYDEADGCIHGGFQGIGTWTHRFSHNNPNMANISAKKSIKYKSKELNDLATKWGGLFRELWYAPEGYKLVGTDAESIQLRVLAHYMDDPEFTHAVTFGNKDNATDPHSLNMRKIGDACKSRDESKTFIYAFILGAGNPKVGSIFGVSAREGGIIRDGFVEAYPGLARLKKDIVPRDARRGYFVGFDGRRVACNSEHLMMAGYLQNGEAVIMKTAVVLAYDEIKREGINAQLINVVHDEMIWLVPDNDDWPEQVRIITENAIRRAGEMYNLRCPMKGEGKIGRNWLDVH